MSEGKDPSDFFDDVEMSEEALEMAEAMENAADELDGEPEGEKISLERRFQMLAAENGELKDQVLRAHAEMDNIRKRAERQVADTRVYAVEKLAGDLLPVSDNFARALEALPEEERAGLSDAGKNLLVGVEAIQKELHAALARHGVTAVDAAPGADLIRTCIRRSARSRLISQPAKSQPLSRPAGKSATGCSARPWWP